jgi:hypothetical protein
MKKVSLLAAMLGVAAVASGSGFAKGGPPGPPFQAGPQCHGQTVAYFAKLAGGLAHLATDPTLMRELQEALRTSCDLVNQNP